MLPDFASLLGVREPTTSDREISDGVNLHHATDRMFHSLGSFRMACSRETELLLACGLAKGPARAIAHVGLEFLLDDALADDDAAQQLYRESLSIAVPDDVHVRLTWTNDKQSAEFEELRQRLLMAPQRTTHTAPKVIAARIHRTLQGRPKLATTSEDFAQLEAWAEVARVRNVGLFSELFEDVLGAVGADTRRA